MIGSLEDTICFVMYLNYVFLANTLSQFYNILVGGNGLNVEG